MKRLLMLAVAPALGLAAAAPAPAQSPPACGRGCLQELMDGYVAALVAHDPGRAPLAEELVTVENLGRIAPGEGLWRSLSGGPAAFQIMVPDPVSQQVGYMGVMQEAGKPVQVAIRLRIEDGKVAEAEHVVVRDLTDRGLAHLNQPAPAAFSEMVPGSYRDARGRLLQIARSYYDALDLNNGRLAPFSDDCVRFENGIQTARNAVPSGNESDPGQSVLGSLGCEAQLDTQLFAYIGEIANRRVEIADPETGVAFGLSHFHHPMTQHEFPIFGVPGLESRHIGNQPFDMPAVHIFKIEGGQIHEIEALGYLTDYNSPTGWER